MGTIAAIENAARADSGLNEFLAKVASEAAGENEVDAPQRTLILEALGGVVIYALWRLAKVGLDRLQGMAAADTLREQAAVIEELVEKGHTAAEANAVVVELVKEVRRRSKDDPVLGTVQKLYTVSGGQP